MTDASLPLALIVTGPTASGKSALAMDLAERLDGVIINADSMQTYRDLRILTARPTPDDEARVPHRLYGIREAEDPGNAAWWRDAALATLKEVHSSGRLPILTGGTGMYFNALTQGIADIPDIPQPARDEARRLLSELGPEHLHAGLAKVDPATAHRLRPTDSQRIARAWEVWRATGQGLAAWQNRKTARAPWRFIAIRLDSPREALRAAIAMRLSNMLAQGAIEEVRALLARNLDPSLPVMRAHGVPELSACLAGRMTLDQARTRIELVTSQYTKRQATWFRHHELADPLCMRLINARWDLMAQDSESILADFVTFIRNAG